MALAAVNANWRTQWDTHCVKVKEMAESEVHRACSSIPTDEDGNIDWPTFREAVNFGAASGILCELVWTLRGRTRSRGPSPQAEQDRRGPRSRSSCGADRFRFHRDGEGKPEAQQQ